MAGNAAGAGETGTWVRISGPNNPTITTPNSATTTITGTIPGTYVFRWRITSGSCPSYTEDNVTVINAPAANAGPDQINSATCGLTTVTLAGNNPAPGTGLWTITSGAGGSFTSDITYNTTFSGVAGNTYSLTWTVSNGITCSTSDNVTITFNKKPTVDAISNQELCNGASTTGVNFSGDLPGTVYNWTNNASSIGLAASGTGNISSFTATNITSAPIVATITVTPSFTNVGGIVCTGNSTSFTITVNPTPTVNSAATKTICDNTAVGYTITSATAGTTFTWTASLTTTPSGGTISGIVASGSVAGINPTLDNTGTSPGVVRYVITPTGPTGCLGTTFNFDVTINPTPDVIPTNNSPIICHNTATNITLSTNVTGATVTYTWTAALQSGTASGYSSGSGSSIAQTLTNTSTSLATVRYTITPAIGSCAGAPVIVDVVVNPRSQVNQPSSQVICNTGSTSSVTFGTTNTGATTTYTWTNNNTGVGLAASGSGDIGSFTATNAGTSPISGTIVVTPTFTNGSVGCAGPTETFTITVNPTGQVTQPTNKVFCNAAVSSVTFATNNTGGTTTYAWTNDNPSIGLAASGTGDLSFTATNNSTAPILANIVVTPTYTNGGTSCVGSTKTFTITVNPSGQVNQPGNQIVCNNAVTSFITFTTNNTGGTTIYSWINDTPGHGLADSGEGDISGFNAHNSGSTPITLTIVVTPTYTNGSSCAGPTKTFTITINPTPTVSSAASKTICDNTAIGYDITSATTGTTFTWVASVLTSPTGGTIAGFSDCAGGCGTSIDQTLDNTGTSAGVVRYVITPTGPASTHCPGTVKYFDVTVQPTSIAIATPASQTICHNTATNIALSTTTTGTVTYSWTAALTTGTAGGFSSGSGSTIAQTLTNTTTAPATVTYTITPAIGVCAGTPIDVVVTVNPSGQVNQPGDQVVCNASGTATVTFGTNNTGGTTTYAWTNNTTSIGLAASGSGDISSFTATNSGTAPVVATIVVTPTFTNGTVGCAGSTKTFTITVNPTGQVNDPTDQVVCNNASTALVTFSTNNTGGTTTYGWTNNTTSIGLAASGSGNISAFTATNSGTAPVVATITVTPPFSKWPGNMRWTCTNFHYYSESYRQGE